MAEARTDEEKAQAFAAMTGSISVIDNCLDDDNSVVITARLDAIASVYA